MLVEGDAPRLHRRHHEGLVNLVESHLLTELGAEQGS
jgi:hypothetical protein